MKQLFVAAIFLAASAAYARAQGTPDPFLRGAKIAYEEFSFRRCIDLLEQASRSPNTPEELVQIEIYSGLCLYNVGDVAAAQDHFRIALRLDAKAELPPLTSPKIVQLFQQMAERVRLTARDEPARVAPNAAPSAPELKRGSAVDAPAPHRSWTLPIAFGSAAVVSTGVALYLGADARQLEMDANMAAYDADSQRLAQSAEHRALYANISFGIAAAAVAVAIISYVADSQ